MPKYLVMANYTAEGTKGLVKEGGTSRRALVQKMTKALGGKMEAFYYAFGDTDAFVIVDVPDAKAMAAVSLAVNASGAVTVRTVPLLTAEDMDDAAKQSVSYRAPGK